jgi:hypothetical protein
LNHDLFMVASKVPGQVMEDRNSEVIAEIEPRDHSTREGPKQKGVFNQRRAAARAGKPAFRRSHGGAWDANDPTNVLASISHLSLSGFEVLQLMTNVGCSSQPEGDSYGKLFRASPRNEQDLPENWRRCAMPILRDVLELSADYSVSLCRTIFPSIM